MPDLSATDYIRGQYDGYLDVAGVRPNSTTETFCALRLEIDNWRWSGVAFFIRAGKFLDTKVTEVRVVFKKTPKLAFAPDFAPDADHFVIRIDPTPGASLGVQAKKPGHRRSHRRGDLATRPAASGQSATGHSVRPGFMRSGCGPQVARRTSLVARTVAGARVTRGGQEPGGR